MRIKPIPWCRSKRSASNKPWSVLVAELEDGVELPLPEEDSGGTEMPLGTPHEEEESDEDVDPDNPQWQLFLAAKNLTAPSGKADLLMLCVCLFFDSSVVSGYNYRLVYCACINVMPFVFIYWLRHDRKDRVCNVFSKNLICT